MKKNRWSCWSNGLLCMPVHTLLPTIQNPAYLITIKTCIIFAFSDQKTGKNAFIMSCTVIFSFFMGNCPWICLISARDTLDHAWSAVFLVRWMTAAIDLHGFPAPFPCSIYLIHGFAFRDGSLCQVSWPAVLHGDILFLCTCRGFVNIMRTSHNLYYVPFRWNFTISGFLHVYAECFCFCVFGFHKLGKLFPLSSKKKQFV